MAVNDDGMSPVELFIGSLASCVGYFVGRYCARHKIPADGLSIAVDWSMAEQPHRVGAVALRIDMPDGVPAAHRDKMLKVAHGCTVHQSLVVAPHVRIELAAPARAVKAS